MPAVQRLARIRLEEARALAPPTSIAAGISEGWIFSNAGGVEFVGAGLVRLYEGVGIPTLSRDVAFEADRFNEIVVRARASAGNRITVRWKSDLIPAFRREANFSLPLIQDGEMHEYVFRMNHRNAPDWCGQIRGIAVLLSDVPCDAEVESVTIRWSPPTGPTRVTLRNETREGLFGSQAPWQVRVPRDADFEASVGLRTKGPRQRALHTTRFRVTLRDEQGDERTVAETELSARHTDNERGWNTLRADLSSYAGQTVTLTLEAISESERPWAQPYWGSPSVYSRADEGLRPVVLISLDTTRADHLSVYGYDRDTTPTLRALAEDGVVFENATAEEPWTLPSHMTMLTGLHPMNHGVSPDANLREAQSTLAEVLSENGYVTAGFTGIDYWLAPWRGLSHGFDRYSTPRPGTVMRPTKMTFGVAQAWLANRIGAQPFLFLHTMDVHSRSDRDLPRFPYGPPDDSYLHYSAELGVPPDLEEKSRGFLGHLLLDQINAGNVQLTEDEHAFYAALYDDAIRYVDAQLGVFIDTLKRQALYDSALIVVTADHGESLFERDFYGHSTVYQPDARVPLIVKFPENEFANLRFDGLVELADIFPTVLDTLGITHGPVDGVSLRSRLRGADGPEQVYLQRYSQEAVRTERWKYIRDAQGGSMALYDLVADPAEREDVRARKEQTARELEGLRSEFFDVPRPGWHVYSRNGSARQPVAFTVQSSEGFASALQKTLNRANDGEHLPTFGKTSTVRVYCEEGMSERTVLEPVNPLDPLIVRFADNATGVFTVGDAAPVSISGGVVSISPDDATGTFSGWPPVEDDAFHVAIFYVAPVGEHDPRPMPESDRSVLESLGYL